MSTRFYHSDYTMTQLNQFEYSEQAKKNVSVRIGPPGTGKTTSLCASAEEYVGRFGGNSIMICSLTKAAAAEVKRRDMPIPGDRVGTMHSHCYRQLHTPTMAESKLKQWNEDTPRWKLTGGIDMESDTMGGMTTKNHADVAYERYTLLRAKMTPEEEWPQHVRDFSKDWEMWKQDHDYCDFEDLIVRCRKMKTHANKNPSVVFLDEAQDSSSSELALAAQWAEHCRLLMIGDPDQAIFVWRGADPRAVSGVGLPESSVEVLGQSYRVPRAVRDCAMHWISQIHDRKPVTYLPRQEDGYVETIPFTYKAAFFLLEKVLSIRGEGDCDFKPGKMGKSVMVIGSCAYHLAPLVRLMREKGVPFHNPYRLRSGVWNPLAPRKGKSSPDRLRAWLAPAKYGRWSVSDLTSWMALVRADGLLARNAKAKANNWELDEYEPNDLEVASLFAPGMASEAMSAAWDMNVDWLWDRMLPSKHTPMEFPMKVVKAYGIDALTDTPGIIVGTVHSLKGSEADVVILLPDLANPASQSWHAGCRDEIVRLMYVGITRAREGLVLASPASPMAVRF